MEDYNLIDDSQIELPAEYASFWLRLAALLIDGLILSVPVVLLQFLILGEYAMDPTLIEDDLEGYFTRLGLYMVLAVVIYWLYFALQESSAQQATLGKRAVGIVVTDLDGNPITFSRATGRYFGKFISSIILYIGYIMAAFTDRKQALHDMMAGTLVLKKLR